MLFCFNRVVVVEGRLYWHNRTWQTIIAPVGNPHTVCVRQHKTEQPVGGRDTT